MIIRLVSDYLDLLVSSAAVLAGIIVVFLSAVFGIHQYGIGFILILAGLIYLFFRKRFSVIPDTFQLDAGFRTKITNNIVFVISLISGIWLLYSDLYVRPTVYFVLTCAAILSICLEIFYQKKDSEIWLILFKIFLVGTVIRAGIFYEFPSIYGIDSWFHQYLIADYIDAGKITVSEGQYQLQPVFHLLVANVQIITGLSVQTAVFLSVSLVEVITATFVFLLGRSVFNKKAGLLAAVLIVISDYWILWGIWIIPQTLGIIFFVMILYSIIPLIGKQRNKLNISFFIVISVLIVFTHSISSFITAITLVSIYLLVRIFAGNRSSIFLITAAFFIILVITQWMGYYGEYSFLETVLSGLKRSLAIGVEFANPELVSVQLASDIEDYLNQMGHVSLLFLGMLSSFAFMNSRKRTVQAMCIVFTMILLYFIAYIFPLFGIRNILTTRWFAFIYVMVAVLAGVTLQHLINLAKSRTVGLTLVTLIVAVVSFFMITNPRVNPDNPLYAKEYAKITAFKKSEMVAAESLSGILGSTDAKEERPTITVDSDYGVMFHYMYGDRVRAVDLSLEPPEYDNVIILREYGFTGTVNIIMNKETGFRTPHTLDSEYEAMFINPEYNRIYDDGSVWAYTKRY